MQMRVRGLMESVVRRLMGDDSHRPRTPLHSTRQQEEQRALAQMVQYPPRAEGVQVMPTGVIMEAHADILQKTKIELGLVDPTQYGFNPDTLTSKTRKYNYNTLVRDVLSKFIAYSHLLPASENHHHSDVGGLIRHSLEVALYALNHATTLELPTVRFPDERITKRPRWEYASWITGLAHDMGKVLYDMRVIAVGNGQIWNPNYSDIYAWAAEHNVQRYQVEWRCENRHGKHAGLASLVFERILTPEAREFLFDSTDDLQILMQQALSGIDSGHNNILQALKKGEARSVHNDMKWQWDRLIGGKKVAIEAAFVKTLRLARRAWQSNIPNQGRIWIIGEDVYLTYPAAISEVLDRMREDGWDVPLQVNVMAQMLQERNLVEPIYDDYLTGHFYPEGHSGRADRVIKVKWPGVVFEADLVPKGASGRIEVTQDHTKGVIYHDDSTVEMFDKTSAGENESQRQGVEPPQAGEDNTGPTPAPQAKSSAKKAGNQAQTPAGPKPASESADKPQKKTVRAAANKGDPNKGIVFKNVDTEEVDTAGTTKAKPKESAKPSNLKAEERTQGSVRKRARDNADKPDSKSADPESESENDQPPRVATGKNAEPRSPTANEPAQQTARPNKGKSINIENGKHKTPFDAEPPAEEKPADNKPSSDERGVRSHLLIARGRNNTAKVQVKADVREAILEQINSGVMKFQQAWVGDGEHILVASEVLKKMLGDGYAKALEDMKRQSILIVDPDAPRRLTEKCELGGLRQWCYRIKPTEQLRKVIDQHIPETPESNPPLKKQEPHPSTEKQESEHSEPKRAAASHREVGKSNELSEAEQFKRWLMAQPEGEVIRTDEGGVYLLNQHAALAKYREHRPGAPTLELKKLIGKMATSIRPIDGDQWLVINLEK